MLKCYDPNADQSWRRACAPCILLYLVAVQEGESVIDTPNTEKLMAAVVTSVVEQGSYVTKTKLLKLLYIFDVEFYRVHRQTFTGFSWKFYHLGPWAAEFDPTLDEMVARSALIQQRSSSSEFETLFFKPAERVLPDAPFGSVKDEYILRGVLKKWGARSTGEILDYVYFQTAPMETAIRNAPLDFSVIQPEQISVYSRSCSGKTKPEIQKLRARFEAAQAHRNASQKQPYAFTPPRYDEEYLDAMAKLETA